LEKAQTQMTGMPTAETIGRWWFKNRSLSPLPLFLLMLVLPPDFTPSSLTWGMSVLGIFIAEGIRLWAVGYAGSATRTRGENVPVLIHAGPYRYVRNPLYIANIMLYTLAGVAFGFIYLSIAIFIYSCIQYTFIVRYEESILTQIFKGSYERFKRTVPRWFGAKPSIESSDHPFDFNRALRSERSTFYSLSAMGVLFMLKTILFRTVPV